MIKNQEIYLYANQSTTNESYTNAIAQSLAGANLIEPLTGSSLDPDTLGENVEVVAGNFDQDAWIPGETPGKGTIKLPMTPAFGGSPTAAGTIAPYWARLLVGLCDFSEATAAGAFTYTPISTATTAGRFEKYYGTQATAQSIRDVFYNMKGNAKITFQGNKSPQMEFTPAGVAGSQDEGVTNPTIAKARVSPYALKAATVTINGASNLEVISGEIDLGQTQTTRIAITEDSGLGQSETTARKIKWKFKVFAKLGSNVIVNLRAGTESAFTVKWGPTYKTIEVGGQYGQITKVTASDENGIKSWDLEGQFNRNDLTIKINPA